MNHYLPKEDFDTLLLTYSQNSFSKMWQSLFTCCELFRKYSKYVAAELGYKYPVYDRMITNYTESIYDSLSELE